MDTYNILLIFNGKISFNNSTIEQYITKSCAVLYQFTCTHVQMTDKQIIGAIFYLLSGVYMQMSKLYWNGPITLGSFILSFLFVPIGHSTTTTNKPVRKTKPVTIKPQLDPETGTVSGKYTLREEYKPKPVTAQLPDIEEKESTTDPYCGIRIM